MQQTSAIYQELLARYQAGDADVKVESRLAIGKTGVLITKQGEDITFGGVSILVGISGADGGYDETQLISINTSGRVFSKNVPTVGEAISSEINVEMLTPYTEIPWQARMVPYVRLTDGIHYSEWIQKGVYYIDTRDTRTGIGRLSIHGYDDMLRAEQDYPASSLSWPAKDIDVIREIAAFIGVSVDDRTVEQMVYGYPVQYPGEYSCREVLGYIAAMYAGCFVMSDLGELRLVALNGIPVETRYLIAAAGQPITFGGVKILV